MGTWLHFVHLFRTPLPVMLDKRQLILASALKVLGKDGYGGLTQPKVARMAGLRQSHLTYYFPSRLDLVKAVAQLAMTRQLAALDELLADASGAEAAIRVATLLGRKENARVLLSLVQAADQEAEIQSLFREFAVQMRARAAALLSKQSGQTIPPQNAFLLHALSVGLAVLGLALGEAEGDEARKAETLGVAIQWLSGADGS